jgi:hypothetical protein
MVRTMGRVVDLTGQTFGRLIVQCRDLSTTKSGTHWICLCSCGVEKSINGSSLKDGSTSSCGCFRREKDVVDLLGKKFGRLTVIERNGSKGHKALWLTVCDCGTQITIPGDSLTSGNTRSCGCYKIERVVRLGHANVKDLTGQTFSRLSVQYRDGTKDSHAMWLCRCSCGVEKSISSASLVRGDTTSCGCYQAEIARESRIALIKDLTGLVFSRLTVLSRDTSQDYSEVKWLCKCECGREVSVASGSLSGCHTRSCGCLQREATRAKAFDLTGKKFGRLTAINRDMTVSYGPIHWIFRCECGTERRIRGSSVTSGNTTSCGCAKIESATAVGAAKLVDITGRKFGRLSVIERTNDDGNTPMWLCLCDCGNKHTVRGGSLTSGNTISCGCAKIDRPGLMPKFALDRVSAHVHTRRTRKTAAGGSHTAAEIDDLYNKQKGRCAEPSCRVKLNGVFHKDHIIPVSLGGSSDIHNIALTCIPCNLKKGSKDPFVWAQLHGRLL